MTDADALLAAVLADPTDLATLRVHGDRLLERGDARGELIHVQCALSQLPDDAPEGPALRRREHQLLAVMPRLADVELGWRHGMIDRLAGPGEAVVDQLAALGDREPITALALDQPENPWRDPPYKPMRPIPLGRPTGARTLRRLVTLPWLGRIETLRLSQHELTPDVIESVFAGGALPRLRVLDLSTCELPREAFDVLHRSGALGGLAALDVGNDRPTYARKDVLDARTVAALVGDATLSIRKLGLSSVLYSCGGLAHFLATLALPHLEELDVSGGSNTYRREDYVTLADHPCAARLRTLDLSTCGVERVGEWLPPLAKLPALEELVYRNNVMYGMREFASVAWPRLRRLDLTYGCLQEEDVAALGDAELPALLDLTVDLAWPELDPNPGLDRLRWPLRRLALPGAKLDARGIAALARTVGPTLRELALDHCGLDARALAALCEASWPHLEALDLSGNQLDEDSARALARALPPGLYRLRIGDTAIAAPELRERFGAGLDTSPSS